MDHKLKNKFYKDIWIGALKDQSIVLYFGPINNEPELKNTFIEVLNKYGVKFSKTGQDSFDVIKIPVDIVNIEDEINEKVSEVREKYWKLESFCRKLKFDYLPLSDENEEIAMKFMDKAYNLTDEQKEYVLANYKAV